MLRTAVAMVMLASGFLPRLAAAQWRSSVLPVLGSAPETGGQFGVAVFRTRQPDDSLGTRPSSLIGNAIVTSKSQQRTFLEYDRWTPGNERRLQVLAIASKFPLPFYGFGDNTPDEPLEYEPTTLELSATRSRKRGDNLWRYLGARYVRTWAQPIQPDSSFPLSCDCGPAGGGDYSLATLTAGRVRDTRDNLFAPTRGRMLDLSFTAGAVWEPDISVLRDRSLALALRVDWRGYRPLRNGGVLAAQVLGLSRGAFPLDQVVLLGNNSINRGYTMGRYRAENMLASQVEWRSPVTAMNNRLGFAAFGGVAFLGGPFTEGRPLPSGGAGLRFRLDPRTRSTIRVDYARGVSGQSGLYVAFNEAF